MASTDTFETTDQHVGEEHVEPVTLTINIEGATLTWTLSRHASHHYAELSTDEQASYQQAAGQALERMLDEGSAMLCAIANPEIGDLIAALGSLLGNPGLSIDILELRGDHPFDYDGEDPGYDPLR